MYSLYLVKYITKIMFFCIKEPDYTMKLISAYGSLTAKTVRKTQRYFKRINILHKKNIKVHQAVLPPILSTAPPLMTTIIFATLQHP